MSTIVDSQGTLLDEAFATVFNRAPVWPFVGMNPVVSLQVRFPVETLH